MKTKKNKISSCLWFDTQAEEAARFYTSVFKDSRTGKINRYGKEGKEIHGKPEGAVMTVDFNLENQNFVALNGGSQFKINPSISFFISRDTKEEVDALWNELVDGGKVLMPLDTYPFSERYGWIQDKYGVSWQLIMPGKEGDWRPAIVPSFLFVGEQCGNAEKAMEFYGSIFKNFKSGVVARYGSDQLPDKEGTVMYGDFAIEGQLFATMDSARDHDFGFNEAISLIVHCSSQEEIDYYWDHLKEGGDSSAQQCGWLKDQFGVSWQIVPAILPELFNGDSAKSEQVMKAMMQMKKIDIEVLEKSYSE